MLAQALMLLVAVMRAALPAWCRRRHSSVFLFLFFSSFLVWKEKPPLLPPPPPPPPPLRTTVRAAPQTVQDSRGRPRSVDLPGLRHCPEFEPRSNKGPVVVVVVVVCYCTPTLGTSSAHSTLSRLVVHLEPKAIAKRAHKHVQAGYQATKESPRLED